MRRVANWLGSRLRVLWRARLGPGARVLGRVWIHGGGRVAIGAGALLNGREAPIELHVERGAEILIGDGAMVEGGTSIEALQRVTVGPAARLGRYCKILDNDFHELSGDRTRTPPSSPVEIGDGAVLEERVILLPGAKVRPRQTVKQGTVVRGLPGASARRVAPAAPRAPVRASEATEGRTTQESRRLGRLMRAARLVRSDAGLAMKLALWILRGRVVFRAGERGVSVRVGGRLWGGPRVNRGGRLWVGDGTTLMHGLTATTLTTRPGGTLTIGRGCLINYGCILEASNTVRLGDRCMVGQQVRISDSSEDGVRPIVIGDDVWLAHGVVVAPGVTIGDDVVVSAGSAVTRDIPSHSFAAGRPARAVSIALVTGRDTVGAD